MFNQKETYRLSPKANMYALVKIVLLITLISLPCLVVPNAWYSVWFFMMIIIGLPIFITVILKNNNTNFSIDENKIIMSWGIFNKMSRTVLTENIQNVTLESGLLMRLFGVSVIRFWTASQSQIVLDKNGNSTKPDGLLVLNSDDAVWLNEYITNKKN